MGRFTRAAASAMLTIGYFLFLGGCSQTAAVAPTPPTELLPAASARPDTTPLLAMAQPSASELRVMTFNVRVKIFLDTFTNPWDSRKDFLIQTVREFDPDVLGTQECLAEQADYIRENLPEYGFVGVGRNDGKRSGEMVGVFYRNSRFELVDSGNFWLSSHPDQPGSRYWDALFPRIVTWVKLKPRDGAATFCIFNTHFDVLGPWARYESAKLLRRKILELAPDMPCIVMGDFNSNASPKSRPYRELLAKSPRLELTDAFRQVHPTAAKNEGTLHDFSGSQRGRRIDWIMTTPQFTPVAVTIIHDSRRGKYPSDHFPVGAVLKINPPTPVAAVQ
jgi:endonuclease/exonuclease/phosphatase family metal-dependent hydrolase